ncbi:hypothetical protein GCM10023183_07480 [Nibribacter koreensis]|uniref:Uncharacterized protein n=1 Tax=Nibribacter koreensis TaxID=1084519 RepID=A0ABP8FA71_9BACT
MVNPERLKSNQSQQGDAHQGNDQNQCFLSHLYKDKGKWHSILDFNFSLTDINRVLTLSYTLSQ